MNQPFPSSNEIWSIIKETQKNLREMTVSRKESAKKAEKEMSELRKELQTGQKELQTGQKELQFSQKKAEKEMSELRASLKASQKELSASQKKTDLQIQKVGGRFNERWGALVESLVEGKVVQIFQERGIGITQTYTRSVGEWRKPDSPPQKREFDIIAANGREAVVVEVKTVLAPKDVNYFIQTLKDFHNYLTRFKSETVYGAVAYLKSESKAHLLAEEEGLFLIQAVGDSASLVNQKGFKPKAFS